MTVPGKNDGRTSPALGELNMHPGLPARALLSTIEQCVCADVMFKTWLLRRNAFVPVARGPNNRGAFEKIEWL
jgi:hypothetical protein